MLYPTSIRTAALLAACSLAPSAWAGTFTVSNLNDTGPGSLRDAIVLANNNPDPSVIDFNLSGTISLGAALPTIDSVIDITGLGQTIAIDGGGAHRVFSVGSGSSIGNLTLSSLTVQNGFVGGDTSLGTRGSAESGAGALLLNGSLTVNNASFTGNTARNGGAIYAAGNLTNALTIDNTVFTNNAAVNGFGGAVFVNGDDVANTGADLVIRNNTRIIDNSADVGAGIGVWSNANGSRTVQISDSTIRSNDGGFAGGGIYATRNAQIDINNTSITENQTTIFDGAGIYLSGGASTDLTDSDVSFNTAADFAGGIFVANGGDVTLTRSTISNNIGTNRAGGIYAQNPGTKVTVIQSSITDNNSSGGWGGGIYADSAEVELIQSLIANNTASGNGGGIAVLNSDGTATFVATNSTISGNHANAPQGQGGGVYLVGTPGTIDSVTFADNIAGQIAANNDGSNGLGGAITVVAFTGQPGVLTELVNSLFSNNWDRRMKDLFASFAAYDSLGYNLFEDDDPEFHPDFGTIFTPELTDQLAALADLLALADNGGPTLTHALGPNSDAIDNGQTEQSTDQRGLLRPGRLADDIGAYELDAVPEPTSLALLGVGGLIACRRRR